MHQQKFTVILWPLDEGSYQAFFPYYPNSITDGDTVEEALANAKEAIEFHLEGESEAAGDPVRAYVYVPHVVISNLNVAVPDNLVEEKGNAESAAALAD